MSHLPTPSTERIRGYLELVRDEMVERFKIPAAEAEGRIAQAFRNLDLMDPGTEDFLGHRDTEFWAMGIYYGPDVEWWLLDDAELRRLRPRPWPP